MPPDGVAQRVWLVRPTAGDGMKVETIRVLVEDDADVEFHKSVWTLAFDQRTGTTAGCSQLVEAGCVDLDPAGWRGPGSGHRRRRTSRWSYRSRSTPSACWINAFRSIRPGSAAQASPRSCRRGTRRRACLRLARLVWCAARRFRWMLAAVVDQSVGGGDGWDGFAWDVPELGQPGVGGPGVEGL